MGKYIGIHSSGHPTYTFTLRIVTGGIVFFKVPMILNSLELIGNNNWRVNRTFLGMEVRIILVFLYCFHFQK